MISLSYVAHRERDQGDGVAYCGAMWWKSILYEVSEDDYRCYSIPKQ